MVLKGRLEELLVNIYPNICCKYAVIEKGMKVFYVRLKTYLYRLLWSALLFYLKLVTYLKNDSFGLNPYNPCLANKLVNEEIITVVWHIDELRVSHKDLF